MGTPHKHAELIKLWADGAEIQHLCQGKNNWVDNDRPVWDDNAIYRVKPRLVKREGWVNIYEMEGLRSIVFIYSSKDLADKDATEARVACIHIEWEEEE